MTLYILEIPHRMPPRCWTASDRDDAMSKIEEAHSRSGGINEYLALRGEKLYEEREDGEVIRIAPEATFDDYIEMNGDDLSSQLVFESEAEARAALTDDSHWTRHGGWGAKHALAQELGGE